MDRLRSLIEARCPDGVPARLLGDVGELVRGSGLPKSSFTDAGVGAIHYGQIYTHFGTSATKTISFVAPEVAARLKTVAPGDVIITNTSENLNDVGKAVAWLGVDEIVTGGHATVLKHDQDPTFIAYWFQSPSFRRQKRQAATGTKVVDVSAKQLAKMQIQLPPLEIQAEIVRVLDRYSSLKDGLEQSLRREQELRRLQQKSVSAEVIASIDSERVPLRELGEWRGGVTPSRSEPRYWESGTVPWLPSRDVSESEAKIIRGRVTPAALAETSLREFAAPSVVVVMRSNILRNRLPIGLTPVETTINQDLKVLLPRSSVDPRYVFQVLQASSEQIRRACVRRDGSMAALDSKRFLDWSIPIPSLPEQRSIAGQLRRFDSATVELETTLAAELSARSQQYACYRDDLMTFKECT